MLTRLVDFLKMKQITAMFTNLSTLGGRLESTDENVSSIMDTWLLLRDVEDEGRRSYAIYVLKSRGMAHSHEMREFRLTDNGIRLGEIFTKGLNSTIRQGASKKRPAVKRAAASGRGGNSGRKR
jgi:circadian clock protein KaiC